MVHPADVPASSVLRMLSTTAWFFDCFARRITPEQSLTALDAYQRMSRAVPGWINHALRLRDLLVRPFGLKPVAGFNLREQKTPKVGEQLDFFQIAAVTDRELVLSLKDSHLDVLISVHLDPNNQLSLTSIVEPHNLLGRMYMRLILPMHRRVVKTMLGGL
ncbi:MULTISPECIES: DUF2867 domain-containing protein [Pseudomonas]|uniref:DUF2867 domain-containing protein n=1 Tax=Pseudomonas putida TaxID=303 RepID=A0A177SXH1_PSEPU|nr:MULTISPECIES: DUF2867 domain-containing protein [Pseudomonas]MDG9885978.1 DUF2867 domain-containing protein [Pseudomonas sp. GD04058]OAI95021.1 hypothetical protein AYO28_05805 [Pseudomonas putida]